jgi:hypothetical protein
MFSSKALSDALQNTLAEANVPSGHANAIVGTVDQHGIELIVTLQREELGATWQLQGVVAHDWVTNDNEAEAKLIVSW